MNHVMTRHPPSSYRIEYQPQLLEETVLQAIVGHAGESIFREERNAIYNLHDEDAREEAFQSLHQQWFERLTLSEPLVEALDYWPILQTNTQRCLLVKANTKKEIGAELFVAKDSSGQAEGEVRSLVVRLTSDLLAQSEPFLTFLRRELLHVVDMLDPEFGYEPNLPKSEIGSTYNMLLQERYSVLWDIVVDGRLIRSGFIPPAIKEKLWKNFGNAFSGPTKDLKNVFEFFVNNTAPKHQELVSFALSPESWFTNSSLEHQSKGMCPLCRFPSFNLKNIANVLPSHVINEIQKEHADWNPARPICPQCIDLYEAKCSDVYCNDVV